MARMNEIILVYITNSSKKEATKVAKHLLDKKLIVCANIFENVTSIYLWEGKMAEETEYQLIVKTLEKHYETIIKEIEKIHSYSIPCIIKIPASANEKYFNWLKSEID